MKLEIVRHDEAVEIRLTEDDGSIKVWLCDNEQTAIFKLAGLLFSTPESKKVAQRSILVGEFEKKDPSEVKKADELAELLKKVQEQLAKDGFSPKTPAPATMPGIPGGYPGSGYPGGTIPYIAPHPQTVPGYPGGGFNPQYPYIGDFPGWLDQTKIICYGPNSQAAPAMGGAQIFSVANAGDAQLSLVGAGMSGDFEVVDVPLNITPSGDPGATVCTNGSQVTFFKTTMHLRPTG